MILLKIVSLMLMGIIRAEGQSGCMRALGMESGAIPNAKVVASSMWDSNHAPGQGRLKFHETTKYSGAWAAKTNDANQWLQLDLNSSSTKVTRVATQGRNQNAQWPWGTHHQWVTKYKLMYSGDGSTFQFYKEEGQANAKEFVGNTDRDTVVTHDLNTPFIARYIRFVPTAWHGHISMRVELYGCPIDNEPPVFTFCPSDISITDATETELRINWPSAIATDNSGVAPQIVSSRHPGDSFPVPGLYEVVYTAEDNNGNKARCSFRITLKRKSCQLHPAPKNGALACINIGSDKSCAVMCRNNFDFKYNPAFIYYCTGGEWKEFSIFPYEKRPSEQWPDCSNPSNPSIMKMLNLPYFYFHGDANDPNVQSQIRNDFYNLASSQFVPPFFCKDNPQCKKENVAVYAGEAA